ncbi:MAG: bifunctional hydroxymethylpyrimidine kinase/phosphomethylpyrimidine kinase [Candidatus Omnitrophica bacterium]|nr:bifunctional hydroxymethylpyrimidine kinase/phosphomethylpyrimidine kinase [Candidatus Omnitrophota bacterium]
MVTKASIKKVKKSVQPLLVVGTVAVDSVETPFGKRDECFGGSASYFSYSASFFTPVRLVAVVGKDFPSQYRKVLEEKNINLEGLQIHPTGKTFRWKGKYDFDLNNAQTLETHLNVLLQFDPVVKGGNQVDYLFLANFDPTLQMKVLKQVERPRVKLVALDTMNFWIQNKRKDLKTVIEHVDLIVLNDGETRQLTGENNLIKAARKIRDMGPDIIVVKKGEHGVLLFYRDQFFALPAFPLDSVFDPTGAGDTFAGGMMGYIAKQNSVTFDTLKRAVAYGSVMASFTVEKFSLDRLRELGGSDIDERLSEFRALTKF